MKRAQGIGSFMLLFISLAIIALAFYVYFTIFAIMPSYENRMGAMARASLNANVLPDLLRAQVNKQETIGELLSTSRFPEARAAIDEWMQRSYKNAKYKLYAADDSRIGAEGIMPLAESGSPDKQRLVFVTVLPRPDKSTMKIVMEFQP